MPENTVKTSLKAYVSAVELARMVGISKQGVYHRALRLRLRFVRFGSHNFLTRAAAQKILQFNIKPSRKKKA